MFSGKWNGPSPIGLKFGTEVQLLKILNLYFLFLSKSVPFRLAIPWKFSVHGVFKALFNEKNFPENGFFGFQILFSIHLVGDTYGLKRTV